MTAAPINGHNPATPPLPPEPKWGIAERLYEAGFEDGDTPWADLQPEEREALSNLALDYISAHMAWLNEHGFKIIPPGSVLRPKSDEEAAMMAEAIRLYHEAQKRKGGLLAGERKLILPKGVH